MAGEREYLSIGGTAYREGPLLWITGEYLKAFKPVLDSAAKEGITQALRDFAHAFGLNVLPDKPYAGEVFFEHAFPHGEQRFLLEAQCLELASEDLHPKPPTRHELFKGGAAWLLERWTSSPEDLELFNRSLRDKIPGYEILPPPEEFEEKFRRFVTLKRWGGAWLLRALMRDTAADIATQRLAAVKSRPVVDLQEAYDGSRTIEKALRELKRLGEEPPASEAYLEDEPPFPRNFALLHYLLRPFDEEWGEGGFVLRYIWRSEGLLPLAWMEVLYAMEHKIKAKLCPVCGRAFALGRQTSRKTCSPRCRNKQRDSQDRYRQRMREYMRNRRKAAKKGE